MIPKTKYNCNLKLRDWSLTQLSSILGFFTDYFIFQKHLYKMNLIDSKNVNSVWKMMKTDTIYSLTVQPLSIKVQPSIHWNTMIWINQPRRPMKNTPLNSTCSSLTSASSWGQSYWGTKIRLGKNKHVLNCSQQCNSCLW